MKGWFGVITKRSPEHVVKRRIEAQGFDVFLPTRMVRRTGRGRDEIVEVALYPRFLVAEFDPDPRRGDNWGPILNTPGVMDVLCNPDGISSPLRAPVPEKAMEAMRSYEPPLVDEGTGRTYAAGEPVTVYLIPGKPQQGIFLEYASRGAKVEVYIFGRATITTAALSAIEPSESAVP